MGQYWEDKSIALENLVQEKTDATVKRVSRMFNKAFLDMDKDMQHILDTFTRKTGLSEEDAIKLLSVKQTREEREKLQALYDSMEDGKYKKAIFNRLEASPYASRITRIEAMRNLVYCEAIACGYEANYLLEPRLIDAYTTSYYRSTFNIQQGTGLYYDFDKITNPMAKAAILKKWKGSNFSRRVWKDTKKLAEKLEDVIPSGVFTGKSYSKMAKELENVMHNGMYNCTRVIRTEVAYISGQGRKMSYDAAEIEKYIFIATLDLRTSAICRSLDGHVFLLKDAKVGENYPPMHPHCRSVESAYIEGKDRDKLERKAINPETGEPMQVPRNMTYEEWYKKYVKGNIEAEAKEKSIKNKASDKKQFERYKARLKGKAPKYLQDFQKMKYTQPDKYKALKELYKNSAN